MNWSPQQDHALKAVAAWLKDPNSPQVFRLFGFAGTGKTTLAKHFAEGVDGLVLFGAFTGKAAHVLKQKGCEGAKTIHSIIYTSQERSRQRLLELEAQLFDLQEAPAIGTSPRANKLKEEIAQERKRLGQPSFRLNPVSDLCNASLFVLDEVSMVGEELGRDVLSYGKKCLVLGDPAQLPPVFGGGFFTKQHPDIKLTEVHRHALDSPVLRLATEVREGGNPWTGWRQGDSAIVDEIDPQDVLKADQVIVGKNSSRRSSNKRMRQLLGFFDDMPEPMYPGPGDKLVCLRNNHTLGLLNGSLWKVESIESFNHDLVDLTVVDEENKIVSTTAHAHHFLGIEKDIPWFERKNAEEFDYGYALTCHKSQGSQFTNVVVFDESYCFRADARRWLYTAITRAVDRVTVVRRPT